MSRFRSGRYPDRTVALPCFSRDKSSEMANQELAVGKDDPVNLWRLVAGRDGLPAWIKMTEKALPTMTYQAWRRDPQNDVEFRTGKLVSFAPGQRVTPRIDSLQINQEFSGLHHLNLSSLVSGPLASFNATGAAHNPKQFTEASSGKKGMIAPFVNRSEVPNGNGSAGNGLPKPRVRAPMDAFLM